MAGKIRHLINRSGRYHARLVIPKHLREVMGKTELRTVLGGDYREALKRLPSAVAALQREIADAERKIAQKSGQNIDPVARYPLAPAQIAHSLYTQRLTIDEQLRNQAGYAMIGIDDDLVERLRRAIAGQSSDSELFDLVGKQVEYFRSAGNLSAEFGSHDWRVISRALCSAELEALERMCERDEGDFTGEPNSPILKGVESPQDEPVHVSLKSSLWTDYVAARKREGSMRDNDIARQIGSAVFDALEFGPQANGVVFLDEWQKPTVVWVRDPQPNLTLTHGAMSLEAVIRWRV